MCVVQYVSVSLGNPLVCVEHRKKNIKEGKTYSSRLAEHAWYEKHRTLWYKVNIFDGKTKTGQRRVQRGIFYRGL